MRFALLMIILLTSVLGAGCSNSRLQYRRETALLRAEILDLEDKYYALKSDYEKVAGQPYNDPAGLIVDEIIIDDGNLIVPEDWDDTEIIIDQGQSLDSLPHDSEPIILRADPQGMETIVPHSGSSSNFPLNPASQLKRGSDTRTNVRSAQHANQQSITPQQITEIVIDREQSRGHDVDGLPGDEGLALLIQPRSASGQLQLEPGELIVSVIDPEESANRQRIGIWKFMPHETPLFFTNRDTSQPGILLHLPWDQQLPRNSEVVVFVRYTTDDGRRLETSADVQISPPPSNYSADEPLIAQWINGREPPTKSTLPANDQNSEHRQVQTLPVHREQSASRIEKPDWRPVR